MVTPLEPNPPGLRSDVWEHSGDQWVLTHQFDHGLEMDWVTSSKDCFVHLPSTSLRGLQQLRLSLDYKRALVLDLEVPKDLVLASVLDQLGDALSPECRREALVALSLRYTANSDSSTGEGEAVDISVCQLLSFAQEETPLVAFARLKQPALIGGRAVRFLAVVLCGPEQLSRASEVGRSFATVFMDESLTAALRTSTKSEDVLEAVDCLMAKLTIVPTVYVLGDCAEVRLADSLVDCIESRINKSRPLPGRRAPPQQRLTVPGAAPEHDRHFYVEVSAAGVKREWCIMRRLHQGLELDIHGHSRLERPHLPKVSVSALSRARRLMTESSIALNISAGSAAEVSEAIVTQLAAANTSGRVPQGFEDVRAGLVERFVTGKSRALSKESATGEGATASRALLRPEVNEESCHVLSLACLPNGSDPVAAFIRLSSPLSFTMPGEACSVRFLFVFIGPGDSQHDLAAMGDSLAALAADEDLMNTLCEVCDPGAFLSAVDARLDNLLVVPNTHFTAGFHKDGRVRSSSDKERETPEPQELEEHDPKGVSGTKKNLGDASRQTAGLRSESVVSFAQEAWSALEPVKRIVQKYSLPLITGVCIALVWSNVDTDSYLDFIDGTWFGWQILSHDLSLHFLVNDIFMCFFFGLAIKEVTEALLPGGSLSPLKRAINPLVATMGGVVGPAAAYMIAILILWAAGSFEGLMCVSADAGSSDAHRRLGAGGEVAGGPTEQCSLGTLLSGWGVPTATDISLAWMFAVLVFGAGHSAINFLLLLAIVDDAIGMGIIAIAYPDPKHPVEPLWLLLVLAAMALAAALRFFNVQYWQAYVFLCGPISWFGLLLAHVHPALALVAVVPFMPASHAAKADPHAPDLGSCDLGPDQERVKQRQRRAVARVVELADVPLPRQTMIFTKAITFLAAHHHHEAPLHVFEHTMKMPVDLGMFFFGLANAGVKLDNMGALTVATLIGLLLGKTLFIAFFAIAADLCGFYLPAGIHYAELFSMSALGGVGLTVALFVANEAFVDPGLKGQAKFGAVLSVIGGPMAYVLYIFGKAISKKGGEPNDKEAEADCEEAPEEDEDGLEDIMVQEVVQMLWMQRKYKSRATHLPRTSIRKPSKTSSRAGSKQVAQLAEMAADGTRPSMLTPRRQPSDLAVIDTSA